VVKAIQTDLTSKLPLNSVVKVDAGSIIIAPDQTAQVTAFSTTAGYAQYPTFFPLALQVLGSGEAPVDGINTFQDARLRFHEVWLDGQVIVDVASLDEGTSRAISAALHDGSGPAVPSTRDLQPPDPATVLANIPGFQYERIPRSNRGPYLQYIQSLRPDIEAAVRGYVIAKVVPVGAAPTEPSIAVVFTASLDPGAFAWLVSGPDGAVTLNAGGTAENPIKVKLGTTTIGSRPDGRTVIAWLAGSVAVLVTARDATVATPVLAGLGAPGY
jgi:hypothetical protein